MAKKKRTPPKKKDERIYATVDAVDGSIEITYDPSKGGLVFKNLVQGTLHHKVSYDRESGKEKIVTSTPEADGIGRFENNEVLKINFDYLFAIDTNTKEISGNKISMSVSYHVPHTLNYYKGDIPFEAFAAFEINDISKQVNPEVIAWHLLIKIITGNAGYKLGHRIGIVVDSELGNLPEFNSRKLPYYGKEYLPSNIHLIYASSDTGKDSLPNLMISYCENVAKRLIEEYEANRIPLNLQVNGDENFRGYMPLFFLRKQQIPGSTP